jgi:hypothetical protein
MAMRWRAAILPCGWLIGSGLPGAGAAAHVLGEGRSGVIIERSLYVQVDSCDAACRARGELWSISELVFGVLAQNRSSLEPSLGYASGSLSDDTYRFFADGSRPHKVQACNSGLRRPRTAARSG